MWSTCSFMVFESGTTLAVALSRSSTVRSRSARRAAVIDATAAQMHPEDLDALVVERQVDEEHLVEASLADHLRGQEVDAVGGGADEEPPGLPLHPGEEEAEDAPELAFLGLRVDRRLDLVEPDDRRRHRFQHVAGLRERALGRPVLPGED